LIDDIHFLIGYIFVEFRFFDDNYRHIIMTMTIEACVYNVWVYILYI